MKTFEQFKEQMVAPTSQIVKGPSSLDLRTTNQKMTALKKAGELRNKYPQFFKKP